MLTGYGRLIICYTCEPDEHSIKIKITLKEVKFEAGCVILGHINKGIKFQNTKGARPAQVINLIFK